MESSRTRDQTHVPCIGRWILNHRLPGQSQEPTFLSSYSMPTRVLILYTSVSSVQSLSRVRLCDRMDCSTPGLPVRHSLLKLMSIESMMPSNHLILCRLLLLPPSIFPSIRVFSNESALRIRWPSTGVSASTSVLPMNIQD